jgi:hypothetical protein
MCICRALHHACVYVCEVQYYASEIDKYTSTVLDLDDDLYAAVRGKLSKLHAQDGSDTACKGQSTLRREFFRARAEIEIHQANLEKVFNGAKLEEIRPFELSDEHIEELQSEGT